MCPAAARTIPQHHCTPFTITGIGRLTRRYSGSRPDGYFMRTITGAPGRPLGKSKAVVHQWNDTAVPAEFKKHDTPSDIVNVSLSLIDKSYFPALIMQNTEDTLEHPPYHAQRSMS